MVAAGMSPVEPPFGDRRALIIQWWMDLERAGDAGATTWEVLDPMRDSVTEALQTGHIRHAESITARAMLLVDGTITN